ALLQGEGSATQEPSQRYVVQVGAYTDAQALREARRKVEKLGFKSYTQVITTDAGARTRVRVGPFANHEQAAEVGAKLKRAGLPVAILGL
ncbi:MAG: SPOR domain-containing protein, partial [Burkholderiales bacterium]|nr:SPOR domain-containing protein [Burkholderiales bacterium]